MYWGEHQGLARTRCWGSGAGTHLALCKHALIDEWRPLYLAQAVPDSVHVAPNGESPELRKNKTSHSRFSRWFHDFEGCPSHCDSL
ncbi:hypothethical protein (plasmid) [Ralstonia solanacearum CMR15]|nr:hypothethical protein [Ralstonia solanacearum CMR15]